MEVCVFVVFSFFCMETLKNPSAIESQAYVLFLVRGKFFHRPMGAKRTDLLSKLVCSETKGEEESGESTVIKYEMLLMFYFI